MKKRILLLFLLLLLCKIGCNKKDDDYDGGELKGKINKDDG